MTQEISDMTPSEFKMSLKYIGMKQTEFATRIGYEKTQVNRWATGRHKVPKVVVVLLEVLISLEDIRKGVKVS